MECATSLIIIASQTGIMQKAVPDTDQLNMRGVWPAGSLNSERDYEMSEQIATVICGLVSDCCEATVYVAGNTTHYYVCEACKKHCDVKPDKEN